MNTIVKPTIILAVVALVASLALSHIKKITYPHILKHAKEKQESALSMVLPGFKISEEQKIKDNGNEFVFWKGEKSLTAQEGEENIKQITGYAFITSAPGYSGEVKSMVGIDMDGKILGISILQQTETPGLGARCIEVPSKYTFFEYIFGSKIVETDEVLIPWFQDQFTGLNMNNKIKIVKKGDWKPGMRDALLQQNSISAITGATVTSRTVVKSLVKLIPVLKKMSETAVEKEEEK